MKTILVRNIFGNILFVVVMLCFTSCSNSSEKKGITDKKTINASIQLSTDSNSIVEDEISYEDYQIVLDTLKISSIDRFVDFPFGSFDEIESLTKRLSKMKRITQTSYNTVYKTTDKFFRFYTGNSFLKFFLCEGSYDNLLKYQIVSAKIYDPIINLNKNIHVGQRKDDFYKIIPNSIKFNKEKINTVELNWEVVGVWQYYTFDTDTLKSIIIESDYILDRE